MAHFKHTTWHRQRGLTLVELMVTIAVIAILATTAVSTMSNMRAKQQVIAAAEEIQSKFYRAKSLRGKRGNDIKLIFDDENSPSTLTLVDATDDEVPFENPIEVLQISDKHSNVSISPNAKDWKFTYLSETQTSGSILISKAGYEVKVVSSSSGRVRICSVTTASKRLERYPETDCAS